MKTYTDDEIVRALECCGNMNECKKECPLDDLGGIDKCIHTLMLNALDLIKRQQAEIERFKDNKKYIYQEITAFRTSIVKEFAERLKHRLERKYTIYGREHVLRHLRELVKEMTEDKV